MTADVKALVDQIFLKVQSAYAHAERPRYAAEDNKDALALLRELRPALTAQAEEIDRLQLRLGSLGANPKMDQDIANLCARLGALHSHRGDGIPTQFVNPDGKDAVAAIERLNAALKAAQEVKA